MFNITLYAYWYFLSQVKFVDFTYMFLNYSCLMLILVMLWFIDYHFDFIFINIEDGTLTI